jgi:hypothetical protein
MKKLIAGLIIVLLLGGIFGIVPSMAYADPGSGGSTNGVTPVNPPGGRGDVGTGAGVNGITPVNPPAGGL